VICDFADLPETERAVHYIARRATNLDEDARATDPLLLAVSAADAYRLIVVSETAIFRVHPAERRRRAALATGGGQHDGERWLLW
jgi:hypothetical protein